MNSKDIIDLINQCEKSSEDYAYMLVAISKEDLASAGFNKLIKQLGSVSSDAQHKFLSNLADAINDEFEDRYFRITLINAVYRLLEDSSCLDVQDEGKISTQ